MLLPSIKDACLPTLFADYTLVNKYIKACGEIKAGKDPVPLDGSKKDQAKLRSMMYHKEQATKNTADKDDAEAAKKEADVTQSGRPHKDSPGGPGGKKKKQARRGKRKRPGNKGDN